jgi:hypothetical protein
LALLVVVTACSGGPRGPKGWKPVPGASAAWSSAVGSGAQTYLVTKTAFTGTLSDLASQVTIDNLLHHPGAKFLGSTPFSACPGAAGLASFRLADGMTLQQGFAVRDGQAVRVGYLRPTGTVVDPSVTEAMQAQFCSLAP